jgi:hypothetical protein
MNKATLIVEFVGLPGVGKSTLSHRVAEELRKDFANVEEPSFIASHRHGRISQALKTYGLALKTIIMHPAFSLNSIQTIWNSEQRSFSEAKNMIINWLYVSASSRRASNISGLHVLDQGSIQAIWSVAMRAGSQNWISLMDLLIMNYNCRVIVVWVSAQIPTVVRRMKNRERKQSRFDRLSNDEVLSTMKRGGELLNLIITEFDQRAIQENTFSQVLIDNDKDDSIESQIQKVIVEINEISVTSDG